MGLAMGRVWEWCVCGGCYTGGLAGGVIPGFLIYTPVVVATLLRFSASPLSPSRRARSAAGLDVRLCPTVDDELPVVQHDVACTAHCGP